MAEKYFRPSLVIFVGTMGLNIFESFRSIIESSPLAEPLQRYIGLIKVTLPTAAYGPKQAQKWLINYATANTTELKKTDLFTGALNDMLTSIQLNYMQQIRNVGYTPKPLQIYIVGDPAIAELGAVLKTVRERLPNAQVYYVLCHLHKTPSDVQSSSSSPVTLDWNKRALADFCYLYEDWHEDEHFSEEQTCYAASQALYSLVTTDITSQRAFEQTIQHKHEQSRHPQMGTLSTCMIYYPYEVTKAFCTLYFGMDMLNQWEIMRDKSTHTQELRGNEANDVEQQQVELEDYIRDMHQWMGDQDIRPGISTPVGKSQAWRRSISGSRASNSKNVLIPRGAPSLAIVQKEPISQQLEQQSEYLFHFFSLTVAKTVYRQTKDKSDWTTFIANQATIKYDEWQKAAEAAWASAREKLCQQFQEKIELLLLKHNNGLELVDTYLQQTEQQLDSLEKQLDIWQEQHNQWHTTKTMAHTVTVPPATSSLKRERIIPANTGLAEQEPTIDDIKNSIEQKATEELGSRPKPFIMGTVAIFTIAVFGLILSTLLPTSLLLFALFLGLGIAYAGFVHKGYTIWYQHKMDTIIENLLSYHSFICVHTCEEFEDLQRRQILVELRNNVSNMRIRYQKMIDLITAIQRQLQQEADDVVKSFFTSPAAFHNMYVMQGMRLQEKNLQESIDTATFKSFVTKYIRIVAGKEDAEERWRNCLHQWLKEGSQETLESEVKQELLNITQKVTIENLLRPADTISHGKGIWQYMCAYILKPLSRSPMETETPLLAFVFGNKEHAQGGQQFIQESFKETQVFEITTKKDDAETKDDANIKDTVDVLVAAFFRGGSLLPSQMEKLFPVIKP